jgi:membrane fusion protein
MSSLFRKEALEHRKDRLFGEVLLLQPFSMAVFVAVVGLVCLMVLGILFWGTYARKETVKGFVVPDQGIVKLYGPQQGSIAKVFVKEGQSVQKGEPLLVISTERVTEGGQNVEQQIIQELETSKQESTKRIATEKALHSKERDKLADQLNGLEEELEQIVLSIETQETRLTLAKSRVTAAEMLKKRNNISELEYQKSQEEYLAQKQQLQELMRLKSNKESAIKQARAELEQLPLKEQTRVQDIEDNISQINQRVVEAKARKEQELDAPISGKITSMQAKPGQFQPNVPLLTILPEEGYLQAELYVPSRAIGFIEENQSVKVRFDAFPYQRYGIYEGKVVEISKNVFTPQELPIPLDIKEPVYRVEVQLSRQTVEAFGKAFSLQAGMSLEADIILDKQSLFDWMLDPLFSLKGKF